MNIWIEDEAGIELEFDCEEIAKKVFAQVLKKEGLGDDMEVSIVLTDDENIRSLNNDHRGIDKKTDVLSFPMLEYEVPGKLPTELCVDARSYDTNEIILGDVVISVPTLIEQAKEYGHDNLREYAFLLTHSFLHLLGYDHIEDGDASIMEDKQKEILEQLNITR